MAVDGISFHVERGEIVGLLGPNGAGKSTTIQMLLGALKPTSGEISYFGKDLSLKRSEILAQVGYLNGYSRMPWNLTVYENLQVHARLYGFSAVERAKRIAGMLELFSASSFRNKLSSQLSAGESTRILLARAFLSQPKLVLLDEPTAALDPSVCRDVIDFVKQQRRLHEVSMLYTSHNMAEVAEICDRVIFLRKGTVLACGKPAELAATLTMSKLKLGMAQGVSALRNFLQERKLPNRVLDECVEVSLSDEHIPDLLTAIAAEKLRLSSIEIEKPTLEDYFLTVSQGG